MKKFFLALSVFAFALSASFISVFAYFSPNVHFVHTRTLKYPVSFSYLMELCDFANVNIANGTFPDQSTLPSNPSARIVKVNSNYVVALYSGNTDTTYSLCPSNKTDGCYYYSSDNLDPDFLIYFISSSCSNMEGYLYSIQNMLTSSLPALFTTQTGQGTLSVAELQYKVWQSVDGLEGSLSSIDSKFTTLNSRVNTIQNRLIKTVNGTSYTVSDLAYNAWQSIQTIAGSVSRSEGYLTTMDGNIEGIYAAMYEVSKDIQNSNFPYQVVSSSSVDADGNDWPRVYIPYETSTDIVSFLNSHYQNRKVSMMTNNDTTVIRWFVRADLSDNRYIRVYCSNVQGSNPYLYYLCDVNHEIYVSKQPTYIDYLTATVNNTTVGITTIVADVDASLTNLNTTVTGLAEAVANINASFSLGGLHLDIGDSASNPIFTTPAASDLYLSSYLTDIEGNNYTVISSPYQSSTDIIGYINSEMVGKPITLLPRQGTREGELTRYVDHAYLDNNNYIRVLAKTAAGAVSSYFLASPEMSIYQSVAEALFDSSALLQVVNDIDTEIHGTNNALGRIEVYTDGVEGLLRTGNQSLSDIYTNTNALKNIQQSILDHLDSSDLVDDDFVSDMVDDWGDHLVYTVLSSDNVLSLFNAAFGDLPSDLDWAGARGFFEAFYRGDE